MKICVGFQCLQLTMPCWTSYSVYWRVVKQIPTNIRIEPKYFLLMVTTILLSNSSQIVLNLKIIQIFSLGFLIIPFSIGCLFLILPSILNILVLGTPCQYIINQVDELCIKQIKEDNIIPIVKTFNEFQQSSAKYLFTFFSTTTVFLCLLLYSSMIQISCLPSRVGFIQNYLIF